MTEPVFVAWGKCYGCSSTVAVKKNRSGYAYANCEYCGLKIQHTRMIASDKLLQGLGSLSADPAADPVPPAKPAASTLLG